MDYSARDPHGLILLVEDDPNQVIFLERALAKVKISNPMRVAKNGEQAVLYMADRTNEAPALVLLDLKVPRIKGLKVLEWIRGQPDLKDTPVVVVTTSIEPDDRRRADELGVLAYICKPVYAEGLLELMDLVPWLRPVRG
ncbi:MAG TPA: response regulator [Planctomycetota bacterium]|nr:response regulator [Planctomycetota bacterium]